MGVSGEPTEYVRVVDDCAVRVVRGADVRAVVRHGVARGTQVRA